MVFNDLLSQSYDCPGTVHPVLSLSTRAFIKVTNYGPGYVFSCDPNNGDIGYLCVIPNHNVLSINLLPPPIRNIYPFL